jgi:hypothetical protein
MASSWPLTVNEKAAPENRIATQKVSMMLAEVSDASESVWA